MAFIKKRMRLLLAAFISLTLLAVPGVAFSDVESEGKKKQSTFQRELKAAHTAFQFGKFVPGAVGMLRDGEHKEYAQSGWSDLYGRVAANPEAKFRIGSNTKVFVATVLLQLESEGKLSMGDTVEQHLPGVLNKDGYDGTKITIRQLLNHTSGIPDHVWNLAQGAEYLLDLNPYQAKDPRDQVNTALQEKPKFAPGKGFFYSNTNYVLAGMIVETVTGKHISEEVTQRIINPLGLSNTRYPVSDPEFRGDAPWMHGYFWIRDVSYSNVDFFGASAAMISTLDDLSTFIHALLSGELLPEAQMKEMKTTVQVPDSQQYDGYGLGITKTETRCGTVWGHTGAVLGYRSYWYSSPDGTRHAITAINEYHVLDDGMNAGMEKALTNTYCEGREQ